MPPKKTIAPVPSADPPVFACGACFFFETLAPDHGNCYAVPPTPCLDLDEAVMCLRPIVLVEDKGCIHWKPRHSLC